MKQLLSGLVLALGLMLTVPTAYVAADDDSGAQKKEKKEKKEKKDKEAKFGDGDSDSWRTAARSTTAPELDPAIGGSALVLLLGGVAYLASRRRDRE